VQISAVLQLSALAGAHRDGRISPYGSLWGVNVLMIDSELYAVFATDVLTACASIHNRQASGYCLNVPLTVPIACQNITSALRHLTGPWGAYQGVITAESQDQATSSGSFVDRLCYFLIDLRPGVTRRSA
jgi:hypothetical protein